MRKEVLSQIIKEKPEAKLVKNKYKVLVGMIRRMYPNNFENLPLDVWEKIAFDLVNGDRDWRILTHGEDEEEKKRLEDNWIKNNL
jgi:hypothetical protein